MRNLMLVSFLLRVGLAVVFLYAAISSFLDPLSWVGFLPLWLITLIPATGALLVIFSIYEIALALWLLSGKKTYGAAVVSVITLLAIIVFNMGALDILFRDIAILFAALALMALTKMK